LAQRPVIEAGDPLRNRIPIFSDSGYFGLSDPRPTPLDRVITRPRPDAEAIYDAILPVVVASPVARGGEFFLRFGEPNEPGVREEHRPIPTAPK